jgi:hypothetical protein
MRLSSGIDGFSTTTAWSAHDHRMLETRGRCVRSPRTRFRAVENEVEVVGDLLATSRSFSAPGGRW